MKHLPIASASIENSSWKWELRLDEKGLYRWYLNGTVETHLRGCTTEQAVASLRRFVEKSLRGELQLTDPNLRHGADSAEPPLKYMVKGTA